MRFVILLFLLSVGIAETYNSSDLQHAFNAYFCRCNECSSIFDMVINSTGYNAGNNSIATNPYFEYLSIREYNFNATYEFSLFNLSVETGSLLSIPQLKSGMKMQGVIAYFHPTLFNKAAVPTSLRNEYLALIGLFGSYGYAMLFTNYIGLGNNYKVMHPYVLYPQQNVQNMIDALNGVKYWWGSSFTFPIRLFVAGYSEGAAYALWFNSCVNNPLSCLFVNRKLLNYTIIAVSGMDGAYDIFNVVVPFLKEKVTKKNNNSYLIESEILTAMGKPGLATLAIASFAAYEKINLQDNIFLPKFFSMTCEGFKNDQLKCDMNGLNRTTISESLMLYDTPEPQASHVWGHAAIDKKIENIRYMNGIEMEKLDGEYNSVLAFVNETFLNLSSFKNITRDASLVGGTYYYSIKTNNTLIFTLALDSLVSPVNSRNFKNVYKNISFIEFDNAGYKVCSANKYVFDAVHVDHIGGEIIGVIKTVQYFNNFKVPAHIETLKQIIQVPQ